MGLKMGFAHQTAFLCLSNRKTDDYTITHDICWICSVQTHANMKFSMLPGVISGTTDREARWNIRETCEDPSITCTDLSTEEVQRKHLRRVKDWGCQANIYRPCDQWVSLKIGVPVLTVDFSTSKTTNSFWMIPLVPMKHRGNPHFMPYD
jgi:hypothetical protein